jgi:hypothetical protein
MLSSSVPSDRSTHTRDSVTKDLSRVQTFKLLYLDLLVMLDRPTIIGLHRVNLVCREFDSGSTRQHQLSRQSLITGYPGTYCMLLINFDS